MTQGFSLYKGIVAPKDMADALPVMTNVSIGESSNNAVREMGGVATFKITLSGQGECSLYLQEIFSAYRLYVDGVYKGGAGDFGTEAETGKEVNEKIQDRIYSFVLHEQTNIVIQTVNKSRCYNGIYYPPIIGSSDSVSKAYMARLATYAVIITISLCTVALAFTHFLGKFLARNWGLFAALTLCFAISISYPLFSAVGFAPLAYYLLEDLTGALIPIFALLLMASMTHQLHKSYIKFFALPFSLGLMLLILISPVLLLLPIFSAIYGILVLFAQLIIACFTVATATIGFVNKYRQRALCSKSVLMLFAAVSVAVSLLFSLIVSGFYEPSFGMWIDETGNFYGKDQMTMYNGILDAVKTKVFTNKAFDFILPAGTAIQNARSSYIGDHLTRDGHHLSIPTGRYIAGLTWFMAITGKMAAEINATSVPQESLAQHYKVMLEYVFKDR